MSDKIKADNFPWLKGRENPCAQPIYKIIARSMSLGGDSVVMLHKAGSEYVINYYIRDLVAHEKIMNKMDEKEANLLKWVVTSEAADPLKQAGLSVPNKS